MSEVGEKSKNGKAKDFKIFGGKNGVSGIKDFFKKIKPEYVLIVAAAVAVIAIFASGFLGLSANKTEESSSAEAYVEMLENKLSSELSKIEGAGKVSVIISVKRGMKNELAASANAESGEQPIIVNGKPIILGEIYPEICGVVIVAQGGNKLKVKMAILNAAKVFLDVDANKIEILTMK